MLERVLIVGAGLSGQDLAVELRRQERAFRMTVVGFVDDDPQKQGLYLEERPVLGTTDDVPRIVEEYDVQAIAVAIHNISGQSFRRILEICESTHARIKVLPDIVRSMKQTHSADPLRPVRPEDLIGRSVITTHKAVNLSAVENRVVLITGAAGSIGSELSRQMPARNPTQLILLDNNESGLHDLALDLQEQYPDVKIIQALVDVAEANEVRRIFEDYRPQIVFHAAAYKHVPMLERHPNSAVKANIGGTRNLAFLSCEYKVERFVLVSTDKAVNPSSVMGASKRICEMVVRHLAHSGQYSTLFGIVRFGNVLGSRGSVIPTFTRQIDRGGPITVTDPEMTRYFMSIAEAANLIIHAACLTGGGDTFLLRMGETVKILELAERMIRLRGMRPYVDIDIKFSGKRPGEKLHEQLYDGTVESARPTIHPGIIRLESSDDASDDEDFMLWIDRITTEGIDEKNALKELLYGLTPSEELAINYGLGSDQAR
ncbi:MAG: polysaccharide biosynthesis protein [Anaerolineae bacterium]|nr:polysaccharide biosynthesis protein [Anaerolineae bacterium]